MADKIKVFARNPAAKPEDLRAKTAGARPELKVAALADTTVIDLYGPIGGWDGITAADFKRTLNGITSPNITLNINSPGGDVFEGVAIHNDLAAHAANVHVNVTGLAASAASIVAMAGDTVSIGDGAFFMIHNSWTVAMGDTRDMTKAADLLAKIDKTIAEAYAKKTGLPVAELADMMAAETWLDAAQSVEIGFANDVMPAASKDASARAAFNLSRFHHVPAALAGKSTTEPPAPAVPEHSAEAAALIATLNRAAQALK